MKSALSGKVRLLGSGSSGGVPLITGDWGACNHDHPKNRRTRTSALFQVGGMNILVDASPDLRGQLLDAKVDRIDAVILTHAHFDHMAGLDELRQIYFKHRKPIPVYADKGTLEEVMHSFSYLFETKDSFYAPFLEAHCVEGESITIGNIDVHLFEQLHGHQRSSGIRMGNVAYSTDVKAFPEASQRYLKGLDLWFVDCLRDTPHGTHAHTELSLEWIEQYSPKQAILIHLSEHLDYEELSRRVPENTHVGYDGMEIEI